MLSAGSFPLLRIVSQMIWNVLIAHCKMSSDKERNSAVGVWWTQPFWGHHASREWLTRSLCCGVLWGQCHSNTVDDELNNLRLFTSFRLLLPCTENIPSTMALDSCNLKTLLWLRYCRHNFFNNDVVTSHRWCTSQPHTLILCYSSCFVVVFLYLVQLMGSSSISHQTLTNLKSLRYALSFTCFLCRCILFMMSYHVMHSISITFFELWVCASLLKHVF